MEGPQRQLGTGLTDRLCSHDTYSLADINKAVRRQGPSIALCADPAFGFAGQHGTCTHA